MKRNLTTIATALMMIFSLSSFASNSINPLKSLDTKAIISSYLDAIAMGNTSLNKYLFTNDFEYINSKNNKKFGKKNYIKFLEETKNLKYDCETNYQLLDESGNTCIAKSTMKFENFTRVDYMTLIKTTEGWQVSKVVTTYP